VRQGGLFPPGGPRGQEGEARARAWERGPPLLCLCSEGATRWRVERARGATGGRREEGARGAASRRRPHVCHVSCICSSDVWNTPPEAPPEGAPVQFFCILLDMAQIVSAAAAAGAGWRWAVAAAHAMGGGGGGGEEAEEEVLLPLSWRAGGEADDPVMMISAPGGAVWRSEASRAWAREDPAEKWFPWGVAGASGSGEVADAAAGGSDELGWAVAGGGARVQSRMRREVGGDGATGDGLADRGRPRVAEVGKCPWASKAGE